ncbi:hypothetical protein F2P56_031775 [Juglans regia]|uniref:Protein VASCULAR ASSOCIATED DEATH 1, chloroplastic isoform X2 n=2 Tax=Juglans regia TaxID=51240 RepID=A0A2I4HEN9_JUGRE|nr:protein VASCULAR ASSOCIATED DEATH 1, chloroplastic isoform X2 [Juglans regia]KAF5446122.1 hypothetical protein F2P56_031775 [Juglans regia]
MAVVSESAKRIEVTEPKDPSPSGLAADAASESSLIARSSFSADTPDRNDSYNSSPNPYKDAEAQSPALLRSEEYRQLFRLPPDDVLVEDFNCALQENILIQGHMYLFVHHICFYSNIFGFETKKIIPFHEVTGVRRAKTAGIFPNAIEIVTGGKKHFFASFLSRDEAFKIINDGWLNHSNGAIGATEQQESASESSSQENGGVLIERVKCFESPAHESDSVDRNKDPPVLNDSLPINVEDETVTETASEQQDNVGDAEPVLNAEPSSSIQTLIWKHENIAAPKIPEFYTKVAESKIPIKVEDFFSFFFTDDAFSFTESFHKRCGDKEFRSSSWYPHDKYGHARDVSFQHPIKIYFGAKFGSCQEIQKFRVYRNSHLVIETSQEISDVPYSDYFRVEGLWDVERDTDGSKECCMLRIYVNVAFSKKTVFKGKIVQSTVEECREAYSTWISMAHELLKQKNIENKEEGGAADSMIQNGEGHLEGEARTGESSERACGSSEHMRMQQISEPTVAYHQVGNLLQGNFVDATSLTSWLREFIVKLGSLKSQNHISVLAIIIFAVIFLMQLSILVLLARPQHIHVNPQADYMNSMGSGVGGRSSEAMAWMEKRIHHLKDEMYMVDSRLERMRHEHAILKAELNDLEQRSKQR